MSRSAAAPSVTAAAPPAATAEGFRFLHAADLHLDSPMLNLEAYDGAPVETFRHATRRAVEALFDAALEHRVAFVVIAGDLYDSECRDFQTPKHLRNQMARLHEAGIPVYLIRGNHDAASRVSRAFALDPPPNVHMLADDAPESRLVPGLPVAVHGQGFATAAVKQDLAAGYPEPQPGRFNLGLLHTNCGGDAAHDNYAPSDLATLSGKGYDYWALGHVHQRRVLQDAEPCVVYPGNLQGRHVNEPGAKGATLVTVRNRQVVGMEPLTLDVLRWATVTPTLAGCERGEDALAAASEAVGQALDAADDRALAVRVLLHGPCEAHRELSGHYEDWRNRLRDLLVNRYQDRVWLEKLKIQTRPATRSDVAAAANGDETDPLHRLIAGLQDPPDVDEVFDRIAEDVKTLQNHLEKVPRDARQQSLKERLKHDAAWRTELLERARQRLLPELLGETEPDAAAGDRDGTPPVTGDTVTP